MPRRLHGGLKLYWMQAALLAWSAHRELQAPDLVSQIGITGCGGTLRFAQAASAQGESGQQAPVTRPEKLPCDAQDSGQVTAARS